VTAAAPIEKSRILLYLMHMTTNKTQVTAVKPIDFIQTINAIKKQEEAKILLTLFEQVTGEKGVMWGPSIIGFGTYHYKYESGREGDFLTTGFSPRKTKHAIYLMDGFEKHTEILTLLGKHKTSKSCLYINKLDDVNLDILKKLIQLSVEAIKRKWK
jgi:hypothetical protein